MIFLNQGPPVERIKLHGWWQRQHQKTRERRSFFISHIIYLIMSIPSGFKSNKTNLINSNNFYADILKCYGFCWIIQQKRRKIKLGDTHHVDNDFIATSFKNMSGAICNASHLGGMYIFTPTFERNWSWKIKVLIRSIRY